MTCCRSRTKLLIPQAKLKRVHADLELKSADAARLASLRESVSEDLGFVYVESRCQRDMYEGRLSSAHAEITALRDELVKCVERYEQSATRLARARDTMRDATNDHDRLASKVQALEAQKKVSDDLEYMLAEAIRKHEDKYETLEISFDVLESAYSFLAAELVRTEHLLKDARNLQKQLWERLHVYEPDCQPLPVCADGEEEAEVADEEVEVEALTKAADVEEVEDDDEPADDDYADTDLEDDRSPGTYAPRTSTAMSMSTASDRSWPATPGLSMCSTSTAGVRSPLYSPTVLTPPLPALILPSKPPTEGCPSAYPSSEPEDVFGSWSMLDARANGTT